MYTYTHTHTSTHAQHVHKHTYTHTHTHTHTRTTRTQAHTRDVPIIRSAVLSVADMLLLYYIGIGTVCLESQYCYRYSACKIILFNARQEVCNWLKDFKIAFILCSSLYNDYNYAYLA